MKFILLLLLIIGMYGCADSPDISDETLGPRDISMYTDYAPEAYDDAEYVDLYYQMIMTYPDIFSVKVEDENDNTFKFAAPDGSATLTYRPYANTYGDGVQSFLDGADAEKIQASGNDAVILRSDYINQHDAYYNTYSAEYYCFLHPKMITWVQIECVTSEIADIWYEEMRDGAVNITFIIPDAETAMIVIGQYLADKLSEDTAIVYNGESEELDTHCYNFAYGVNSPEKFTAEEHYIVTDGGDIFILDILSGEYIYVDSRY